MMRLAKAGWTSCGWRGRNSPCLPVLSSCTARASIDGSIFLRPLCGAGRKIDIFQRWLAIYRTRPIIWSYHSRRLSDTHDSTKRFPQDVRDGRPGHPHMRSLERYLAGTHPGSASPGRETHSNTTLYISIAILYRVTKYTGRRQNDFNVYA